MVDDLSSRGGAERRPKFCISQDIQQVASQLLVISSNMDHAREIANQFWKSASRGHNHGQATRHRFEWGCRKERLPQCRVAKDLS
jgi:hypothetical protein